jgi:transketolase
MEIDALRALVRELRIDIIRMLERAGSGHPGGSLSVVDVLAALYTGPLRHKPEDPSWPDRDRVVLSKGHCCPALYAVLARCGYFPRERLCELRRLGSPLQGHPDRVRLPGMEASTGSLGQGLSVAVGMALAARIDKKGFRVWCVLGDGEMQEGQGWEAAMSAKKFGLGNLTAIVDLNGGQIDGPVREVMDLEPIADKFRAFGWGTAEIDGHDFQQITDALAHAAQKRHGPAVILSRTVKGKGVSFMEGKAEWHGKAPTREEADRAVEELSRG